MKRNLFILPLLAIGCTAVEASPDVPDTPVISRDSSKGLGFLGPGGADDLAATEVFQTGHVTPADRYPLLFYWNAGVILNQDAAGCICLIQGSPVDITVDARCRIADTAPGEESGFGLCRRLGTESGFKINRAYFRENADAVGKREGVCEADPLVPGPGGGETGRPCRDNADCRLGSLPGTDVCDTTAGSFDRTFGVFIYGAAQAGWSTEK